jgi:hypothetical protein
MKTPTNRRQLLQAGPRVVAPVILNAMHAKTAEAAGVGGFVPLKAAEIARPAFLADWVC